MKLDIEFISPPTFLLSRNKLGVIEPLKSAAFNVLLLWRWISIFAFRDAIFLIQVTISHMIIATRSSICIILICNCGDFQLLIIF